VLEFEARRKRSRNQRDCRGECQFLHRVHSAMINIGERTAKLRSVLSLLSGWERPDLS
jgi:hypothetical protein